MFTGIVREVGSVLEIKKSSKTTFSFSHPKNFEIKLGDSVSCNGVCLTVAKISEHNFSVDVMNETLNKTNFDQLKIGDFVNLEPASRAGDRLDGHIVQGHVDIYGLITKVKKNKDEMIVTIDIPESFDNLIVEKGSVCVDGISLTIFDLGKGRFSISLVDYTLKNTNANNWKVGDRVNIEFDIIGKYVAKILNFHER